MGFSSPDTLCGLLRDAHADDVKDAKEAWRKQSPINKRPRRH